MFPNAKKLVISLAQVKSHKTPFFPITQNHPSFCAKTSFFQRLVIPPQTVVSGYDTLVRFNSHLCPFQKNPTGDDLMLVTHARTKNGKPKTKKQQHTNEKGICISAR